MKARLQSVAEEVMLDSRLELKEDVHDMIFCALQQVMEKARKHNTLSTYCFTWPMIPVQEKHYGKYYTGTPPPLINIIRSLHVRCES